MYAEPIFFASLLTSLAMVGCHCELLSDMNLKHRLSFSLVFALIALTSLLLGYGYPLFYGALSAFFMGGVLDSIGLIRGASSRRS
jgi:hypothetical protein